MADDREKNNQLVKAKTSSLQKRASNIVSRGLSDLALLDVEKAKIADKERLLQAKEWFNKGIKYGEHVRTFDKAMEAYTKAIELDPNFTEAYRKRGWSYYAIDEYDEALEDYTKAIALDPNYAADHKNRGQTYDGQAQYDMAIEDYTKAIELDPNDDEAYFWRGRAYERLGNKSMAISDYRKACDLGDEDGCENLQRVLRQR